MATSVYRDTSYGGIGIAMLPDYLGGRDDNLVELTHAKLPEIDTYLTYAEERRNSKRIAVSNLLLKRERVGILVLQKMHIYFRLLCIDLHR